jgi:hypothetical protein
MIYMGARWYLPNTNRMLTPDTIIPDSSNPQSFNRYSYGYNNPVKYSDPTGHYVVEGNGDTGSYGCQGMEGLGGCSSGGYDANGMPVAQCLAVEDCVGSDGEYIFTSEERQQIIERNRQIAGAVGKTAIAIVCEACDWYMTLDSWAHGDFHWADAMGLLPFIPAVARSASDDIGDVLRYGDDVGDVVRRNPLQGLPRVGSANKTDVFHSFSDIVDNYVVDAQKFSLSSGADLYQLEGAYSYYNKAGDWVTSDGIYEWIVDQNQVTHRVFIPSGTVTGIPNQWP